MPAPKGNQNAAKGFEWINMLRRALAEYEDTESRIERGQALYAIARGVVKDAIAGNPFARQEIANRLDGKPKEHVHIDQTITKRVSYAERRAQAQAELDRGPKDAVGHTVQ